MKQLSILLFCIVFTTSINAQVDTLNQIFIDTSYSNIDMVSDFFNSDCVEVSNATFTGTANNAAFFDAGNSDLGINFGIVLSTGNVFDIPFTSDHFASTSLWLDGDSDLADLSMGSSFDAIVLEFDFTALASDTIFFEYVFASEEYPEFVGTQFNDVFAFFITDENGNTVNRATIPGQSNTPVTINSVNQNLNTNYYIPYGEQGGLFHSFDGMTTPLPAVFEIVEGESYHVKVGVSDIADGIYDSGVFIGVGSLCNEDFVDPIPSLSAQNTDSLTIQIEANSAYATNSWIEFGDNTILPLDSSVLQYTYEEAGTYTLKLHAVNSCCYSVAEQEITVGTTNVFHIEKDKLSISPNPVNDHVTVEWEGSSTGTLSVFDQTGRLVLGQSLQSGETVFFNELPPGNYAVIIETANEIISTRFMKQ